MFGYIMARLICLGCVQGWSSRQGAEAIGDGMEECCRVGNVQKFVIYVHCFVCSVAQTLICHAFSLKLHILDDRLFALFTTTAKSIH
jgi:hypothetical protein